MSLSENINCLLEERLPENLISEEAFEDWYGDIRTDIQIVVLKVYEKVSGWLDERRKEIHCREDHKRRIWDLAPNTGSSLLKSVGSLRSKIGRELLVRLDHNQLMEGRISVDNLRHMVLGFPDLGRFRIVCDFLDDLILARDTLLVPADLPLSGYHLLGDRNLCVPRLKDYIHDLTQRHPSRGHRASQFYVQANDNGLQFNIEIQLMTLLQHAWDRRNHGIYEWSREGGTLSDEILITDVALAETLYLVDRQASENWKKFLEEKLTQNQEPGIE